MSDPSRPAVEPLLPVMIMPGRIRYAPAVRAGRWVFATGHKGVEHYDQGMSSAVLRTGLPMREGQKLRREADLIFRNLARALEAGGSSLRDVVRVDQNYTTHEAVEPYHDARRAVLRDHIPPSTSTMTQGLLLAGQEIEVHMIGIVPQGDWRAQHIRRNDPQVHPSSGYSLGLAAGDFLFVAGRMADSFTFGEGVAPEARMPPGHLWKGDPLKLEAEFVIRRKIEPVLAQAGSSLDDVVKWQVYLRDPKDVARFREVWGQVFAKGGPATTVIATSDPGFFLADARIEINTIALKHGAGTRRDTIDAGIYTAFAGFPQAVRAGDLLFLSGLLAVDEGGLVASARTDPAKPWFGSSAQAQMEHILANAERICRAAGTSLANVVRIQQYHTDRADFTPAMRAWEQHLPGQALPWSAIEVPFLHAPGSSVMVDLWVYVPG